MVPLAILAWLCTIGQIDAILYDSYRGTPLTSELGKKYKKENTLQYCTNNVEPCDEDEGRRIDGTCNNLKHPSVGAIHTPTIRLIPPEFSGGNFNPRRAKDGGLLPNERKVRTDTMPGGRALSLKVTQLAPYFFSFMSNDVGGYYGNKPVDCCTRGNRDKQCAALRIPEYDPVFRFSNIRCMNFTKPETMQQHGCLPNNSDYHRLTKVTPTVDLSPIYDYTPDTAENIRTYRSGRIKFEDGNGKVWPPSQTGPKTTCLGNKPPRETRCFSTLPNTIVSADIINLWFYLNHNFLAYYLAKTNRCWKDEKLFNAARELNIAIETHIYAHELLSIFLSTEKLMENGVIMDKDQPIKMYNDTLLPQVSEEYLYMLMMFETIMDGRALMYDADGNSTYFPLGNLTARTGFLAIDNNLDKFSRGSYRQSSAGFDHLVDPMLANLGAASIERVLDRFTYTNRYGRFTGIPPYIKYREFCSNKPVTSFEDLADVMSPERIAIMKQTYENVEDMDLLIGAFSEEIMNGTLVTPTVFCIMIEQLIRSVRSDRFSYENTERPNPYSKEQIEAVGNMSMAKLMCIVADEIKEIQPEAFRVIGPGNELRSCDSYKPLFDFSPWKDPECQK